MPKDLKHACADPLKKHKRKIFHNIITVKDEKEIEKGTGKIKRGDFLCGNCYQCLKKNEMKEENVLEAQPMEWAACSEESMELQYSTSEESIKDTQYNKVLTEDVLPFLNESPIKTAGLTSTQKKKKSEAKIESSTAKLRKRIKLAYDVEDCPYTSQARWDDDVQRYEGVMEKLKEKFHQTESRSLKLQILSLYPFTIEKTKNYFKTSSHMVRTSRELGKEHGILPEVPKMSKGKALTNEVRKAVREFYELDEFSRICPGMRDYKRVNEDGVKVFMQKRLILCNLKELFKSYSDLSGNAPNIGFSTFASLRPVWCILAGSGGTHSVCVCTHHQNPKLQVAALGISGLEYKDLIARAVCNINAEDCMIHTCTDCPRAEGVRTYLHDLESIKNVDSIKYKQWETVDRCSLVEKIETPEEYIESLSSKISKLTRHHYVAKKQAEYLKSLKENLDENEGILIGDFSENFSFLVQDAAQGFHWENSQCTVHPFVYYYKENGKIISKSYCFTSDSLKHNTILVHSFLKTLIPNIQEIHLNVTKIHYFSDGCASQYKNKSNFLLLCYHFHDFGIKAEWHFFATCHGKNACDGIGGTVKRAVARASLQRPINNQILTAVDFFKFCNEQLDSCIKFYFVSIDNVKEIENSLKERLNLPIKTIKGTMKFHRFTPINKEQLKVRYLSSSTKEELHTLVVKSTNDFIASDDRTKNFKVGTFVGCNYDNHLWIGLIEEYNNEFEDYTVKFLYPSGVSPSYTFPAKDDICPVSVDNIIGTVNATLRGGTRIQYVFPLDELQNFSSKL